MEVDDNNTGNLNVLQGTGNSKRPIIFVQPVLSNDQGFDQKVEIIKKIVDGLDRGLFKDKKGSEVIRNVQIEVNMP